MKEIGPYKKYFYCIFKLTSSANQAKNDVIGCEIVVKSSDKDLSFKTFF